MKIATTECQNRRVALNAGNSQISALQFGKSNVRKAKAYSLFTYNFVAARVTSAHGRAELISISIASIASE